MMEDRISLALTKCFNELVGCRYPGRFQVVTTTIPNYKFPAFTDCTFRLLYVLDGRSFDVMPKLKKTVSSTREGIASWEVDVLAEVFNGLLNNQIKVAVDGAME